MRKEKSELERVKKFMYDIKYGLTTYDKLKIMVEICCVASVSPINCWKGFVFFGEERNKLYETDVSDLEYTMEKVRDFITRNFKTSLDNQTTQELFDGKIFKKDSTTKDTI